MKQGTLDSHIAEIQVVTSIMETQKDHPFSFSPSYKPSLPSQLSLQSCQALAEKSTQQLQFPKLFNRYDESTVKSHKLKEYPLRVNMSIQFISSNLVSKKCQNKKKSNSVIESRHKIKQIGKDNPKIGPLAESPKKKQIPFKDKNRQSSQGIKKNTIRVFNRKKQQHPQVTPLFMTSFKSPTILINQDNSLNNLNYKDKSLQHMFISQQLRSIVRQQLANKNRCRQAQIERGIIIANYQEGIHYEKKMKLVRKCKM